MGYGNDRGSSSAGAAVAAVAAVLVVVLLLIGGLMTLGAGAWVFARARAAEERAQVNAEWARQQAMVARERAQALAADVSSEQGGQTENAGRMVTIQIDQEGNLRIEGDSVQLAELQRRLQQISTQPDAAVVINVDQRCLFQHVASVLDVCREIGIQDVRVESLSQANDIGDASVTKTKEAEPE